MDSRNITANSSLGILDLADSRLSAMDCLTDLDNMDCSIRFKKTIRRLRKTCNEKLTDLTANFDIDVSKFHLDDQNDGAVEGEEREASKLDSVYLKPSTDLTQSRHLTSYTSYQSTPKEKGEADEASRLDSVYLKPSTNLTQSRDLSSYATYQSTPKEKSRQSVSTSTLPRIPSFGPTNTIFVGNDSELSVIPSESFSSSPFKSFLPKDPSSRKENKPPQERSVENGREATSTEHDVCEASFLKEKFCGPSLSQESFTELRKKFELNSDGSASGSTLKLLKSPPVRRSLSLDDGNAFDFERRNTGFSGLSINSSMFRSGVDAINAIDEDEREFREENRFEISQISNISTIPPDFSHVSDPASGDYFHARSEKVGGLGLIDSAGRPSLGLQIVSPPTNPLGQDVSRPEQEASLFGEMSRQSGQPTSNTGTASTVQCRFGDGSSGSSNNTVARSQAVEQPSSESGYQSSQQPLHVYIPARDRASPFYCTGQSAFQYPPSTHPWGEQGPCSCPPFHHNSGYGGPYPQRPNRPIYNQPPMAQDFFKVIFQPVLPEHLVCINDVKEVDLILHNPSYQNLRCHVRMVHVAVLESVALKIDAMANSEFVMPGAVEVIQGTTQNLKLKCSFKLPAKYRVHLEVVSESSHFASSSSCAFTIEVEEPRLEMCSASHGANCIDFGRIVCGTQPTPRYIRITNKSRSSVPVKISINSICDASQKFSFPPDLLYQLVTSTSHTWCDVLLTYIVVHLDGSSTVDIPVTVDTSQPLGISQGENFVASVQLSLKGNVYRTKHLMKICATLCSYAPAPRSTTTRRPPVPAVFAQRAEETVEDSSSRLSEPKVSCLASSKRSIYFPGVEVGQTLRKTLTLMNKSRDTKLVAQLILISSSPQQQYFIRDGEQEYSRLQNILFEPQQRKDFPIVFRPTTVASSSCSLQVKACTTARRIDKQDFLVPICGYGGASQVTMIRPNPSTSRKANLLVSPLNKGSSEHSVRLRNSGSRAAFVAILPLKDGHIELDNRVTLSHQALVISPGETTDVKMTVTFTSLNSSIFTFSQSLSFLYGDEQLRKILKNKIISCDTSDRRLYDGPGLMKTLDILQPFHGEESVLREELYQEFKKEIAEVFYESIKVYDVVLSTNVDISDEQDDSFFTISNLNCSYGSLLNSTVFARDNSHVAYGMSPPIRDISKKKK